MTAPTLSQCFHPTKNILLVLINLFFVFIPFTISHLHKCQAPTCPGGSSHSDQQATVSKPTLVLASKSLEPPATKKSQVVSKKSAKVVAKVPMKSTHVMSKGPKKTATQSAHKGQP